MKKGRHRRFEEARALKRSPDLIVAPCAECGAEPGELHASWCLAIKDDEDVCVECGAHISKGHASWCLVPEEGEAE